MKITFALFLCVGVLSGCATMETVEKAPLSEGASLTFAASYDAVSGASLKSLSAMNVHIRRTFEKPEGLVILVSKSMTLFSWGEVGRVFVKKPTGKVTTVYVQWEKRSQMQITGTGESEFSLALFRGIQASLQR